MNTLFKTCLMALIFATVCGCGGGGSSITSGNPNGSNSGGNTIVSGKAVVGAPTPGTVNVYKVDPITGAVDYSAFGLLKSVRTQLDGSYSADLGTYTGPVYLEAFGKYRDEATGNTLEILESAPLKAAIAEARGSVTISLTPLTTLAVEKAASLRPADVAVANALISDLFKIDIINTKPVSFFDAGAINNADQETRDYTLAIAAFSQMTTSGTLANTIDYFRNQISQGVMSVVAVQKIQNAAALIGPAYYSGSSLTEVGTKTVEIGILVDGPPAPFYGIDLTLRLPVGVSVKTKSLNDTGTGTLVESELMASGVASGIKINAASFETPVDATYGGNVYFTMGSGTSDLTAGEIATLRCYYKPGLIPTLPLFTIANFKPVDGFGMSLSNTYSARLAWKLLLQ